MTSLRVARVGNDEVIGKIDVLAILSQDCKRAVRLVKPSVSCEAERRARQSRTSDRDGVESPHEDAIDHRLAQQGL